MPRYVIRRIRIPHCKRGPERCQACREQTAARPCLLDVEPPDADRVQRPVLEFTIDGETAWRAYDVVRVFADEEEARQYAAQEGITDLDS